MENEREFQKKLFEKIKQQKTKSVSLVKVLAEQLEQTESNSYKRIEGKTTLSFDEGLRIARYFGISIDSMMSSDRLEIPFHTMRLSGDAQQVELFLNTTYGLFHSFDKVKNFQGIYSAKDIPIFYYFYFPELAKFKLFFWLKTMKEKTDLAQKSFDPQLIGDEIFKVCEEISKVYARLPFTEIWNEETVTSTLRQIAFYEHSGYLLKPEGKLLCEQFTELIKMIERQCASGIKQNPAQHGGLQVPYKMYIDELSNLEEKITVIGDDDFSFMLLTYNAMDYLYTFNPGFTQRVAEDQAIQIKKAVPFSGTSERERNRFFNNIYQRIGEIERRFV